MHLTAPTMTCGNKTATRGAARESEQKCENTRICFFSELLGLGYGVVLELGKYGIWPLAEQWASTAALYLTTEINIPYITTYACYVQTPISLACFTASSTINDKPHQQSNFYYFMGANKVKLLITARVKIWVEINDKYKYCLKIMFWWKHVKCNTGTGMCGLWINVYLSVWKI